MKSPRTSHTLLVFPLGVLLAGRTVNFTWNIKVVLCFLKSSSTREEKALYVLLSSISPKKLKAVKFRLL